MLNKKNIVSAIIFIAAIVISSISTFAVKGNADEETLQMVKEQLQQQINDKTDELEDKDKKIEELNKRISDQQSTIDDLNSTVNKLSDSVKNTQQDLNAAKDIQKADKQEVVNHADSGDENLQKQINEVKNNNGQNRVIPKQDSIIKNKEE